MHGLPPEALEQVAAYFQALAEPTRLRILNELRDGERNVGELAEAAGSSMANVSRHLAFLTRRGMVARETRGTAAYYRIADPSVYRLCDIVCGSIARFHQRTAQQARPFTRTSRAR
jgi:DNA-binding transcriptional ArsR family regulator